MKKNMYRLVAFLLACCVTMTFFVTSALASEEDGHDGNDTNISQEADEDDDEDTDAPDDSDAETPDPLPEAEDDDDDEDDEETDPFATPDDEDTDGKQDEDPDETEDPDEQDGPDASDDDGDDDDEDGEKASGGASEKEEKEDGEEETQLAIFDYDAQPSSAEDVLALVEAFMEDDDTALPKWLEPIDSDWLPLGWTQERFTDEETGMEYWQLVRLAAAANLLLDMLTPTEALQASIDAAQPGDTIVISDDINLADTLIVDKDLTFKSGGGTVTLKISETTAPTAVNAPQLRHILIINDAQLTFDNVELEGDDAAGGILIQSPTKAVTLDSVVIRGCHYPTNGKTANGAAVQVIPASTTWNDPFQLTITGDSLLTDNRSSDLGGAISNNGGQFMTLTIGGNTKITNNYAKETGGAIYGAYGVINFEGDVVISGNTSGNYGGALIVEGAVSTANANSLKVTNNTAKYCGGFSISSINNPNVSPPDVPPSVITGNVLFANNTASYGGALELGSIHKDAILDITISDGVVIEGNKATGSADTLGRGLGGGIYVNAANVTISGDVTIKKNTSTYLGGGIYNGSTDGIALQTLTLQGPVVLDGNKVTGEGLSPDVVRENIGGGAYAAAGSSYTYITADESVVFRNNSAPTSWYLDDEDTANQAIVTTHNNSIKTRSFTGDYAYAYNNNDIILTSGRADGLAIVYLDGKDSSNVVYKTIGFPGRIIPESKRPAAPAAPAGYLFVAWYDAATDAEWDFDTTLSSGVTLYAAFEEDPNALRHTVTFDSNGGSSVASQRILDGQTASKPQNPTRSGFDFIGWYTTADLATEYNFDAAVTTDITLYAKWQSADPNAGKMKVTFHPNGGTPEPATQYIVPGEFAVKPSITKKNYTLVGWYFNEAKWDFSQPVTSDMDLYAEWEYDKQPSTKYTVTFHANGGTPTPAKQSVNEGDTATEPEAPTKEGFIFAGWYTDQGLNGVWDFSWPVNNSINLYAKWITTQQSYTVTFYANGGHFTDHGDTYSLQFLEGQTLSLTGLPSVVRTDGYTHSGKWYTEAACTNEWDFSSGVMPSNNISLYAGWTQGSGGSGGGGGDVSFGGGSNIRDIYPGDVPLAQQLLTLIEDEGVPLAELGTLPKTGRTAAVAFAGALCASALAASILLAPRRTRKDEE